MRRGLLFAMGLALMAPPFGTSIAAAPPPPPPAPLSEQLAAGAALAEHLRSSMPGENAATNGTLIIKSNGTVRRVPIVCRVILNKTNWETDYETPATAQSGAERLVVLHSTNGPNQYFYARAPSPGAALPPLVSLPPADASIPLAGSDFSLTDLGLDFLHWPVQRQIKEEMRLGEPCYLLESSNSQPGEIVRVRSDIDKDYGAPLIVDGYDARGRVVKEFSLHGSSFKRVNGHQQLRKMEIYNKKTGSRTTIEFDLKE